MRRAALVDARDIKNVVRRVRPELELGVRVPAAVRERVFAVQRPAAAVVRARERRRDIAERVVDDRLIEDVRARMRLRKSERRLRLDARADGKRLRERRTQVGRAAFDGDVPLFVESVDDLRGIRAVIEREARAATADWELVAGAERVEPFRVQAAERQRVAAAGEAAVRVENPLPPASRRLAACVVGVQRPRIAVRRLLRLDDVIRRARRRACLQRDVELHVVRAVESVEAMLEVGHAFDLAGRDREAVLDVAAARRAVARDRHVAVLSFDERDVHRARVDRLRRQVRAARQVAVRGVPVVEPRDDSVEIVEGDFLADGIGIRRFDNIVGQQRGRVDRDAREDEARSGRRCFLVRRRMLDRAALRVLLFLHFPPHALRLHALLRILQLAAGVRASA